MKPEILVYQVHEIPDRTYPQYQMAAGGDVLLAVGRDFEHLLRTLSNLSPGSVSITIRFIFSPRNTNGEMQSRLKLWVIARAHEKDAEESLRLLLECGPLSRFYDLRRIEYDDVVSGKFQAACEIIRREDAVEPLYTSEFNPKIPSYYYTIRSFEPNDGNDYMDLDRVLNGIKEEILIDMRVEPVDISEELSDHTRYLSQLQAVNRIWDRDEDEDSGLMDYMGDDSSGWRSTRRQGIKPLRYRDPLADDILRSQQRFHETLRQPHLLFRITVLAETQAGAHLIGSVVAESAFEGGSYRLLSSTKGDRAFDKELLA